SAAGQKPRGGPRSASRALCPTSETVVIPRASEGLSEADVDLDRRVSGALMQRGRQVEPKRPERSIVAQTQPHPIEKGAAELRHGALVIAASIDERDDADGVGDLDPGFQVERQT